MRDVYLRCITVFAFFFNEMLQEWDELPKPGLKPRSRPGVSSVRQDSWETGRWRDHITAAGRLRGVWAAAGRHLRDHNLGFFQTP